MTLQTVPGGELTMLTPAGQLGDDSVETGVASDPTPAIDGAATTDAGVLALTYSGEVAGVAIRALVSATGNDLFTPSWVATADAIRWRVGAGSFAEETNAQNPAIVILKTGAFDWTQTSAAWAQPNGDPWTPAAVNALEVAASVGWSPEPSGTVEVRLVEARVIVYGTQEGDVHVVTLGAATPSTEYVGSELRTVAVGEATPRTAYVGEEE